MTTMESLGLIYKREGREEGRKEGREEGRKEEREKVREKYRKIIINMYKKDFDIQMIIDLTEMDFDFINKTIQDFNSI